MSVEIILHGETVTEIERTLEALHRPDPRTMPLDDLMRLAKDRFAAAGFAIEVKAIVGEPQGAPLEAVPAGAEAAAEAIVEEIEEVLAEPAKRKRGRPAKVAASEPAEDVEGDRTYVLDELTRRFSDDEQKLRAKAFIDKVAKRNGGVRLTLLDHALFPAIRAEMETEFNTAGNGAGGRHA